MLTGPLACSAKLPDIARHLGQVIVQLVVSAGEAAHDGLRNQSRIPLDMVEGDDLVVEAVIEEDGNAGGEPLAHVLRKFRFLPAPDLMIVPEWACNQEYARQSRLGRALRKKFGDYR